MVRAKGTYRTVQEREECDEHREGRETDPTPGTLGMDNPDGEDESYNIWLWKPKKPSFLASYNQYGLTPEALKVS